MQEGKNNYLEPKINISHETESESLRLSFQDLVSATVEPGDGALSKLWSHLSLLPREQSQEIYELLMDLELRIRRYLITEENNGKKKQQPTVYARLLVDAVNSEGEILEASQRALVELSSVVVAEIAPILRHIHVVIAEIAPSLAKMQTIQNLSTNEGLLNTLAQGSSGREDALSFFGIFRILGEKIEKFPSINLSETNLPQKLMVEDPLGVDTVGYFKERQDIFTSIYGRKISLPQLLASRSVSVAYELDAAAQHLARGVKQDTAQLKDIEDDAQREKMQAEIDGKRDLRRAYATLAQWVNTEAENLDDMSDTSFQSHVASLTFAWGDPDEITDILNSLEAIKHDNPELYARMLGIQAQVSSSEAQRSNLFGNVLHIAVHRSLHARTTADIQGLQFFHDRMAKLTELGATQDALVHINERQWHKLEKLLVPQVSGIAEGSVTELWKAKQYAEFFQSYQLRKMLEAADIERREELLQRLREATPREFISLVKKLPHHGQNMLHDPAIVDIFKERGLIQVARSHSSDIDRALMTRPSDVNLVGCVLGYIMDGTKTTKFGEDPNDVVIHFEKETDVELNASLWKTAPSEKLLEGNEFSYFATTIIGSLVVHKSILDSSEVSLKEIAERYDKELTIFCAVLNAHPDITKDQWIAWYKKATEKYVNPPYNPWSDSDHKVIKKDESKVNRFKELFEAFLPRHVAECNSRFFVIADVLKLTPLTGNSSPILTHSPQSSSDDKELLRVGTDFQKPHVKLLVQYRTTDTKEFLKQHREEFEEVDLDIFFSILSSEEQIDILCAIFDDKNDNSFYWKILNASRNEYIGNVRLEKAMQKYKFIQWRMKLLNIAERLIPKNDDYKKVEDFYFTTENNGILKYRCVKKKIEDGVSEHEWSLEFEALPQVWKSAKKLEI